jgi:hypothetical protein
VCISFMASLEELRARFGPSRLSTLLSSAFCLKLFPLPKLEYICSVFGDKCIVPPKELDPTLPPLATVMSFAGPNLADSMSSDREACTACDTSERVRHAFDQAIPTEDGGQITVVFIHPLLLQLGLPKRCG